MKKFGLVAAISFFAGALFFALSFGYFQGGTVLSPQVVQAESGTQSVPGVSLNFAPLVKKVKPAVVKVIAETVVSRRGYSDSLLDRFFNRSPRQRRVPGVGSGFFISSDGYLITNNHVVSDAVKVEILNGDKTYTAKVIGTDPKTDLALLKIKGENLPFIRLGDSNRVEVGEWVLAIGNPLGQDLSVTAGIISAKGRQLGVAEVEDFLQTDASINKGNSGGPLVNMEAKVIGINSVILGPTGGNIGIGFAIPSNIAKKVVNDLKTKGRVVRGYMGIGIEWLDKDMAKEFDSPESGAIVTRVEKNSPAAKCGLKRYDVIVKINGERIQSGQDLVTKMAGTSPGDTIKLVYYRDGKKKTVSVEVGEAPDTVKFMAQGNDEESARSIDLGMVLAENSRELVREFQLQTSHGLVVKEIKRNSVAYNSRLRVGDVILEVNGKEVNTVDDFRRLISNRRPGSRVMLYVNRDGEEGMVRFRLPE
jgi:serine protease Do